MFKRLSHFIVGMLTVCLGIVLCKKCAMGISPVSSIPYVLSLFLPFTFGQMTMLFHYANTIGQMILKRQVNGKLLLQFLLSFGFSIVIDWIDGILQLDSTRLPIAVLALAFSIFFTALGMVLMFSADLVQNPVDGFVKAVAEKANKSVGNIKIGYDCCCVLISLLLSAIFLHQLKGFGFATIASALFVGKCVNWIRRAYLKIANMQN